LLVLPAGVAYAIRRRKEPRYQMLLWWAIGGLVYFSVGSATKRSYYMLPLYPAFALFCGAVWDAASRQTVSRSENVTARPLPPRLFRAGAFLASVLVTLLGLVAVILPFRYALAPKALFVVAGLAATVAGTWSCLAGLRHRWTGAMSGALVAVVILQLLYVGHIVPPLNSYISGKPFYEAAGSLLGPGRLAVFHAHRSLTAFYMDRRYVPVWRMQDIRRALRDHRGGFLVADPRYIAQVVQLKPVLVQTLHSPFGQTRQLGLFRLPSRRLEQLR
jgi:uncharacterized membrane protein YfcA